MPNSLVVRGFLPALALLVLLVGAAGSTRAETLTIFAAASTTEAVQRAAALYEAESGDRIVPVFASSSTLAKQIAAAAPADVFLSASLAWMDYLEREGRLVPGSRRDLLHNHLVVVVPPGSQLAGGDRPAAELLRALPDGARLAIGDPDHVPAGIYARQALIGLGLWQDLADRIAPASDVRAALTLVERGETPAGIVYATDAAIAPGVRAVASLPRDSHDAIVYPIALVEGGRIAAGRRFLEFLASAPARRLFESLGFGLAEASRPAG